MKYADYIERSDEELKDIAMGLATGAIFTDRQCESTEEVAMCFMPFALADEETRADIFDVITGGKGVTNGGIGIEGALFQWVAKANSSGYNGKPVFASVQLLSPGEAKKVDAYLEAIAAVEVEAIVDEEE